VCVCTSGFLALLLPRFFIIFRYNTLTRVVSSWVESSRAQSTFAQYLFAFLWQTICCICCTFAISIHCNILKRTTTPAPFPSPTGTGWSINKPLISLKQCNWFCVLYCWLHAVPLLNFICACSFAYVCLCVCLFVRLFVALFALCPLPFGNCWIIICWCHAVGTLLHSFYAHK